MQISEHYKLFFRWLGLRYNGDIMHFSGAWFEGPVLSMAARIAPNDFINLDLTQQNMKSSIFIPGSFYIASLKWGDVSYKHNIVELSSCSISHNRIGSLKDLKEGAYILIDCSKHEQHSHARNLVYSAWVVNGEGEQLK